MGKYMVSVWCLDCKNYCGGNLCLMGQDPDENDGVCVFEEKEENEEDDE